jgi:histidinol-phosphatase (PHP family)
MRQTNFHTHTKRCHHAINEDEEYVLNAIKNGYEVLGFSDHACWKYDSNFVPRIRMRVEDFSGYKESVLTLKEKYKDQIEIRLGMEAEYFPKYMDWLLDFCIENEIEYLVFGNHYYQSDETRIYLGGAKGKYMKAYFDTCVQGMKTGMYAYLAHPELILRDTKGKMTKGIERGFHLICRTAKELDMPLEFNIAGMQCNMMMGYEEYPNENFWRIASTYKNKAIIGVDAHEANALDKKYYDMAKEYLERFDVEIVDDIPRIDYKKIKENR